MTPVTLGAGWPRNEPRRDALEPRSGGPPDRRASLKDILDEAGSMPLPAALLMFDDVLDALEKLQATTAVHGAVSVGAVRLDEQGRCHLRSDDGGSATFVAGRGGTHRYAAPEVRRGGSVTATADAYAATAVFAEAVTGLPPDVARDVITTESAGSKTVPENPVPPAVRRLVDMGMAADEARRPPNAAALRDALNTASTAAFPMVDWRARGRAWLAAAVHAQKTAATDAEPASAAPLRIPTAPAPIPNFGVRVDAPSTVAATAAASSAAAMSGAGTTAATGAASAAGVSASLPLPWKSGTPSFDSTPTPAYGDRDGERLPPLPGFFRRLGRGDPGIVAGCGIAVIGFVLVLIGGSVALSMSGPNNASAAQPTPGISAPDNSSGGTGFATPPAVGSSLTPAQAGEESVSPSPGAAGAASAVASPTPTDTTEPTFTPIPEPSFSSPPTPTPTPTCTSLLGLGC